MKDAIGSYFNYTLLFVFIFIVVGFITLAMNYTKAYRVKNNVLTYLEKYEGNVSNEEMLGIIDSHIKSVGYQTNNDYITAAKDEGYECPTLKEQVQGWCYKKIKNNIKKDEFNIEIVVFINLDIPFINRIFPNVKFFWMSGLTNSIPILE